MCVFGTTVFRAKAILRRIRLAAFFNKASEVLRLPLRCIEPSLRRGVRLHYLRFLFR